MMVECIIVSSNFLPSPFGLFFSTTLNWVSDLLWLMNVNRSSVCHFWAEALRTTLWYGHLSSIAEWQILEGYSTFSLDTEGKTHGTESQSISSQYVMWAKNELLLQWGPYISELLQYKLTNNTWLIHLDSYG